VQVFINLISNAQKYCHSELPELTITPHLTAKGLAIDFVDNGAGIAAGEQTVIFEKFYRASGAQGDGAGLGLAICQEIMARLGGHISYLQGRGGGAFQVFLPQSALAPTTAERQVSALS
jgi:K+-sensing histidine kinase KdpD